MCGIVILALAATAYMAVVFNRRAKADLLAALSPLAEILDGDTDLENASVRGRYRGHIAEGRATNSPSGPGKVFVTSVIDGAGGIAWSLTASRNKAPGSDLEIDFDSMDQGPAIELAPVARRIAATLLPGPGWLQIAYDPAPGHVVLTRPMSTRRDVPDADVFRAQLDSLVILASENRNVQHAAG